jgi:hypothetical protein
MAKVVSGTIIFGGLVGGTLNTELTMDNGQVWYFAGGIFPVFGIGITLPIQVGNFPGIDQLAGGCMLEMAAAAPGLLPLGGLSINFNGGATELGYVAAVAEGMTIAVAVGGGKWFRQK